MFGKERYANGQRTFDLEGTTLTYNFKNGKVKTKGAFIDERTERE